MFEKYLLDYYKSKIGVKEICEAEGVAYTTFNRYLKRNNLLPRTTWYARIDSGIPELNAVLKERYSSIVNRCKGKTTDYYGHYKGKDYMPIYEWSEYCNRNADLLRSMWKKHIENDDSRRYSISVDRLDNSKGYTEDNIEFVTHGFNSWKRSVRPIKVERENETDYFMMSEEASEFYGLRRQTIGEILNKKPYHIKGYDVQPSTVEEVLSSKGMNNLKEYYQFILDNPNKKWDTRKRYPKRK